MEREKINDLDLDKVVGGSIVFNEDCTMCGRNRNDQYKVLDFNAALAYAQANVGKKPEKQIINDMLAAGLIANP